MVSREDFKVIVASLKAAYPNIIESEHSFNLWYAALHDLDYPTLNRAAMSYIISNHFPPAIADLRKTAYDLTSPADDIVAEEWSNLMKALGYSGSPDAYDHWLKLSPITKEIVGSFNEFKQWGLIQTMDLMSVQRPMFIKRYEERLRVNRQRGAVPVSLSPPVRQLTAETVAMIEEKREPGGGVEAPKDRLKALRERLSG